jgi:pyruvate kinase
MSLPRTKIVATLGPASRDPEVLRQMIRAGMTVARLNFSHGRYEDHAQMVTLLRSLSAELDTPICLLQDLQGPKIRVQTLPEPLILTVGETVHLAPEPRAGCIALDYPHLAADARVGCQILLDDGLLELVVVGVAEDALTCQVVRGGILKSRKGVNLPNLEVQLPSLTEKDRRDLEFGLSQGVDWISLSFVRRAADLETLKALIRDRGHAVPVIAKIEKPQAIAYLEEILAVADGVMVARGDLGVEVSPERVPLLQKRIIRGANLRGIPVITATQMLESMIQHPRPTRAEASDVANAILDGTDAVMLSGESAVGAFPVAAVSMMRAIALEVEPHLTFTNQPPYERDERHAVTEALNTIDQTLELAAIICLTNTGMTARLAAAERPRAPILAVTPHRETYRRLNLIWGVVPVLVEGMRTDTETLVAAVTQEIQRQGRVREGDRVLILGSIPVDNPTGTNFLQLHRMGSSPTG